MLDEPDTSLHARLATLVGATHVITHAPDMAAWLTEPRDLFHGRAACVVRPGSTAEVALAFADAYRVLNNRITLFANLPIASLSRLSLQHEIDGIGRSANATRAPA